MKKFMKNMWFPALLLGFLCVSAAAMAQQQGSGSSKPAQPAGKHVPQAKTKPEFADYNAAYAVSGGAASEKAAEDFAAKYPDSELKSFLYSKAMHEYQTENNKPKIEAMGEKVLQLDPDNPVALVLTATVLADTLADTDTDRAKKVAMIKKNSDHALETINSDFAPGANVSPEQLAAYKRTLQSMAHSALGIVALKSGDDAGAEKELKTAADANSSQPDPYVWYHLALAQDHQKKYPEALASVSKAVQYAGSDPELAVLAQGELTRLQTLNQVAPDAAKPQPPK
ncbi:MAG TPA: tetratricopeptide repeat protein [Candidatus Angelobacter sp.]|jgi:tetratricopeptide (TPR) repeat protein